MAEEETKKEEQASSQQVETTETEVQEQAQEETIDWQARHKELEAEHAKLSQKASENEQLIELVTPHVDWNAVQGAKPAEPRTGEEEEGADQYISKKAHDEALRAAQDKTDVKLLTLQFRTDHPELRDYESTLVGPEILRLRRSNPHLPADQLIAKATKFATDFLEAERAKGGEKAKQQQQTKAAETAKASGFASAGTTSPKKEEAQVGETPEQNIARRREQSRKSRGLTT